MFILRVIFFLCLTFIPNNNKKFMSVKNSTLSLLAVSSLERSVTSSLIMETLLGLPSDVFTFEICEWLSWRDLCCLDEAVTNKRLRLMLYDLYKGLQKDHVDNGVDDKQLYWMLKRNISQRSLSFVPGVTDYSLLELSSHEVICSRVTYLDLSHCRKVTDVAVISLARQCTSLTHLNLSFTHLRSESLIGFATTCPSLTHLDVTCCHNMSDNSLQFLMKNCQKLREMTLRHCQQLSFSTFSSLSLCSSSLTSLDLCYCKLTEGSLGTVLEGCASLTALDLSYCLKTAGSGLISSILASRMKLINLNLSHWEYIGNAVVSAFTSKFQLCELNLSGCRTVSDTAMLSLPSTLHAIGLSSCDITDDGVIVLAERCAQLTCLCLSGTEVTDVSLTVLCSHCHQLESLYLTSCAITDAALHSISQSGLLLKTLDIRDCQHVSADAVASCFAGKNDRVENVHW